MAFLEILKLLHSLFPTWKTAYPFASLPTDDNPYRLIPRQDSHETIGCYSRNHAYVAVESRDALSLGKNVKGRGAAFGSGSGVVIRDLSLDSPFRFHRPNPTPPKSPPKSIAIPAIGLNLQPGTEGKEELPE
jgi:hypothetical protein